jgi:hypothetical protein
MSEYSDKTIAGVEYKIELAVKIHDWPALLLLGSRT